MTNHLVSLSWATDGILKGPCPNVYVLFCCPCQWEMSRDDQNKHNSTSIPFLWPGCCLLFLGHSIHCNCARRVINTVDIGRYHVLEEKGSFCILWINIFPLYWHNKWLDERVTQYNIFWQKRKEESSTLKICSCGGQNIRKVVLSMFTIKMRVGIKVGDKIIRRYERNTHNSQV